MPELAAAIGYALGVLSVVLAGEWERRKKAQARPIVLMLGEHFANSSPRRRTEAAQRAVDALYQDSTLPSESK